MRQMHYLKDAGHIFQINEKQQVINLRSATNTKLDEERKPILATLWYKTAKTQRQNHEAAKGQKTHYMQTIRLTSDRNYGTRRQWKNMFKV